MISYYISYFICVMKFSISWSFIFILYFLKITNEKKWTKSTVDSESVTYPL